ncbi:hypothetical protein [Sphingorhabdus sp. 109]|uniref:hypothetical protein n=1 Tax=Sphingorhabdus sp. 109 TaxID=2653173 RepID=UPI0013577C33|nr:hypothetical protein [Sphingorhabdus sp. 109]
MAATVRYDFSTFAPSVPLTLLEVQEFLRLTTSPQHANRFVRVAELEAALEARMRQINARSPAIDGKSTNPFVLAAYAHLFDVHNLKQVDDIVAAAKVFSSIETAAGRVVEDVIPPFYDWTQIDSPGHTVLSEIDSARVVGDTVELVALKSGPMCINDSMVSQIANAVASHWVEWSDHWEVDTVRYIVGMNYSTAKNSNKKDWHIVRLAQERLEQQGINITSSCSVKQGKRPLAVPYFEAEENGKTLRVETLQGRALWAHIGGGDDTFLEICWAMAKCLKALPVPIASQFTTGEMKDIVEFADRIDVPDISEAEKQWLVLFARHFVDKLFVV